MIRAPRAGWLAAVLVVAPAVARAQALPGAIGARAVGRAGAAVVTSDDGTALWHNPAGLARRGGLRAQLGWQLARRATRWRTGSFADMAPEIESRAGPTNAPTVGVVDAVGERFSFGIAYFEPDDLAWEAPAHDGPADPCGPGDDRAETPHRYAGTALRFQRRALAAGGAVRALPWLAVGASALAMRTTLRDERVVWGGQGAPARIEDLCPAYDLTLTLDATDAFVPGAAFGLLVAPPDLPLELALSLVWSASADLTGAPGAGNSRGTFTGPLGDVPNTTATLAVDAGATTSFQAPLLARAGARLLLPRVAIELDAELAAGASAGDWRITGLTLTANQTMQSAPLPSVPGPLAPRDVFAVRAAVDVDVADGLTLTAGWAWRTAGVDDAGLAPAAADLGSHTIALGVELRAERATITLGIAHAFDLAASVAAADADPRVLHPLANGDVPAAGGDHDGSLTTAALSLEIER